MTWGSNNGREDGTRGIISGETGLTDTESIINNKSCNFFVYHYDL